MEEKKNNEVVSGALREALRSDMHALFARWAEQDDDQGMRAGVWALIERALSLSSPIEPAQPTCICNPYAEPDAPRAPNCRVHSIPSEEYMQQARDVLSRNDLPLGLARILAAQPTPQASSEIREALGVAHLYILRNDRWSEPVLCRACLKSAMLAKDIQHVEGCLYIRIDALLAPSRQGATK